VITHPGRSILGDIPEDWQVALLNSVLVRSSAGDWGEDHGQVSVPVLRSTNFTPERRINFADVAVRGFSSQEAAAFDIRAGDIFVERSGGGPTQPVGRVVVAQDDLPSHGFSNFVQLFRANPNEMDADYVAWCLYQLHQSGVIERLQHQTTQMRNLDLRDYLRMQIPKPRKEEQAAIAERITIADDGVRRFRAEVEAATQLRTALIQTLLTGGLPGRHDTRQTVTVLREEYEIPASWRFERLDKLLSRVDYGTNAPSSDAGWPVVAIPQVIEPVLLRREWPLVRIQQAEAAQLRLEAGDVLLIRTNGNPAYIGKSTVVPQSTADEHIVFASYLIRVRAQQDELLGPYLNLFLTSPLGRRQLLALANTSAGNYNLGARSVNRILIPLPDPDEQIAIVERVAAAERLREALNAKVAAAVAVKTSLLQNLLVGRARIAQGALA
jgi:type I restriction enzyme S subunit